MSGVTFRIEQQSDKKVVLYLQSITPRMLVNIYQAMKAWIYAGANVSVTKYFAGSQSVERGARNTGDVLVSRTGTLRRSIIASVDSGMNPSSPEGATVITATWGAATPYARIQEYGGYAGRGHKAYIPPRPYLGPARDDTTGDLIAGIKTAVEKAIA
jgi:phage gpG-like protein